jgi:hypothetical protein
MEGHEYAGISGVHMFYLEWVNAGGENCENLRSDWRARIELVADEDGRDQATRTRAAIATDTKPAID